jgi:DNA-directed RNA polymerase specialized sigma24 family protein
MSRHEVLISNDLLQTVFGGEDPYFAKIFSDDVEKETILSRYTDRMEFFLKKLPEKEEDIIRLYYVNGKKQSDIAHIFGMTQAAVSYRLKRAKSRLCFYLTVPELTEDQIRDALTPHFAESDVNILVLMHRTTCQSEVAKMLGLTQGRVRHRFFRSVEQLKTLSEKIPSLVPCYKFFSTVADKGFNLGREVSLPQWEDRGVSRIC